MARTPRVVALGGSPEAGAETIGSQHRQDFGRAAGVAPDHGLRRHLDRRDLESPESACSPPALDGRYWPAWATT